MPRPRCVVRDSVGLRVARVAPAAAPSSPVGPRSGGVGLIDGGPGMAWPLQRQGRRGEAMPRPRCVDHETVGLRVARVAPAAAPSSPVDPRSGGVGPIDGGPGMAWPLHDLADVIG